MSTVTRPSDGILRSEHFIAERVMVSMWFSAREEWNIYGFTLNKDGAVEAEAVWYRSPNAEDCESVMMAFEDAYARLMPAPAPEPAV